MFAGVLPAPALCCRVIFSFFVVLPNKPGTSTARLTISTTLPYKVLCLSNHLSWEARLVDCDSFIAVAINARNVSCFPFGSTGRRTLTFSAHSSAEVFVLRLYGRGYWMPGLQYSKPITSLLRFFGYCPLVLRSLICSIFHICLCRCEVGKRRVWRAIQAVFICRGILNCGICDCGHGSRTGNRFARHQQGIDTGLATFETRRLVGKVGSGHLSFARLVASDDSCRLGARRCRRGSLFRRG